MELEISAECKECAGKLKIIGLGNYGDTIEVECLDCGDIYDVEPDGLGCGGEEWAEAMLIQEKIERG